MNYRSTAESLYDYARVCGAKYFHELSAPEQLMWVRAAWKINELNRDLQNTINDRVKLRKELDDTKKAVNDIKGKPPGWYHTMETNWATKNFNFPAEPEKYQEHTATDGSKWKYQWCTEWWDLVEYAPEEGVLPALGSPEVLRLAADVADTFDRLRSGDRAISSIFRERADCVEREQAEKAKHDALVDAVSNIAHHEMANFELLSRGKQADHIARALLAKFDVTPKLQLPCHVCHGAGTAPANRRQACTWCSGSGVEPATSDGGCTR